MFSYLNRRVIPAFAGVRFSSSASAAATEPLVVGNTKVGIKDSVDHRFVHQFFIPQKYAEFRPRADAGNLLMDMDTCGGRTSFKFIYSYSTGGHFVWPGEISVATVSFNSFMFTKPVYEGDLVRHEGRAIQAGSSSVVIWVQLMRQSYDSREWMKVGESFVSMVTVDRNNPGKAAKNIIPAVRLTEPEDIEKYHEYMQVRKLNSGPAFPETLSLETVELPINKTKKTKIPLKDTIINSDQNFGVENMNYNGVLFGGDTLAFMEKSAVHCGRVFARKPSLFTLGMLSMTFQGPILKEDLVRSRAQVSCVRKSTLIVDVVIEADFEGKRRSTNRASFVLVSLDASGKTSEIETGIDLREASEEELKIYWRGREHLEEAQRFREKNKSS